VREGLIGSETNRAAALLDSRGHVWIGTDRGVSVYREEFDRSPGIPPLVELLDVQTKSGRFPLSEPVSLRHGANSVVFRFRAISFVDEARVRFRTRLEGFDPEWSAPEPHPRREIRYTNLPAGEYRFHLQAIDVRGDESEMVVSAPLVVRRPFWGQAWFRLVVAGAIIAIAYVVVSWVIERRYAKRLEIEVRERAAEVRALEAERAKTQRLEALAILAGGIAHDFNNLLTAILGNLSLLADDRGIRGKPRELVDDALTASQRARSLTRQLLTFSKGGAPVRKAASIGDVIRDSASFVVCGASVRCEFDLPDDLRAVEIDADQMSQVINNLMINARQAMPRGGTVHVRGRNLDEAPSFLPDGRYVVIEVEDEGVGIPADIIDHVFDPYFSTKEHGSGLGLASAYSIVDRHDGRLTVDSAVGEGSVFRIYLPASDAPIRTTTGPSPGRRRGSGRILVVDDEAPIRRVVGKMLVDLGYSWIGAAEGSEAIEIYRESLATGSRFGAVIMDLTVAGGMGGREAALRLAELDPGVKVIVASGYSNDPVIARYTENGFCGWLAKPFVIEDLARVLGDVVAGAGSARGREAPSRPV
jgi:signal transduction histidine kinase/CheY-like chemotaxis protein